MKKSTDIISITILDDMSPLDRYFKNYHQDGSIDHKFFRDCMDRINECGWEAKGRMLHKLTKMEITGVISLQFMTRRGIENMLDISGYAARRYKQLGQAAQAIGELELYLMYVMKTEYGYDELSYIDINRGLFESYHSAIIDNMTNTYWQNRFRKMVEVIDDHRDLVYGDYQREFH